MVYIFPPPGSKRAAAYAFGPNIAARRVRRRIVAKSGFRLARYAPYIGGAALAAGAGYAGYRMYRRIKRRRGRRRPTFSARLRRNKVGDSPRRVQLKRVETAVSVNKNMASNIPYVWDVTDIAQGDNMSTRVGRSCNISGFKYCLNFFNSGTSTRYCNVVFFTIKKGTDVQDLGTALTGNARSDMFDWFRSTVGNDKGIDFYGDLNYLEKHCKPVNSDKYLVLRHHRFQLSGAGGQDKKNHHDTEKLIMRYVRVNRQIHYDSTSADSEENGKIYMAIWYTAPGVTGTAGGASDIQMTMHNTAYFREPRN